MVHYRRNRVEGASYFFTLALADRTASTLTAHISLLGDAMRRVQEKTPFDVDAIVVLPEHLHTIWTLPPDDSDYSSRWKAIKSNFTHAVGACAGTSRLLPRSEGGYRLWQRRFWEHTLRDDRDVERHMDYIHFNPVKHGWVARAADWPHSSFHRYVRAGMYGADWGLAEVDSVGRFGEP